MFPYPSSIMSANYISFQMQNKIAKCCVCVCVCVYAYVCVCFDGGQAKTKEGK